MTKAASSRRAIRIPADPDHLAEVREFVRAATTAYGAAPDVAADLVQAVDEAVCNVVLHGYHGDRGDVEVQADLRDGRIEITILDRCETFDPMTVPGPDLDVPPARRKPGGMGIHLLRSGTDAVHHRARPGGGNELLLVKRLDRTTEEV